MMFKKYLLVYCSQVRIFVDGVADSKFLLIISKCNENLTNKCKGHMLMTLSAGSRVFL